MIFQVDVRNDRTGEVLFKDNFPSSVAGIVQVNTSVQSSLAYKTVLVNTIFRMILSLFAICQSISQNPLLKAAGAQQKTYTILFHLS